MMMVWNQYKNGIWKTSLGETEALDPISVVNPEPWEKA